VKSQPGITAAEDAFNCAYCGAWWSFNIVFLSSFL